jgi:chemotaxis-related protein WspD
MTRLQMTYDDCWNRIGVRGDGSCPELPAVVHCHNCPVFARTGRQFLDTASPDEYLEEWTHRLAQPLEEVSENRLTVLTFCLGDELLALPVRALVEVTETRPIHRVPHRGGLLAGLVNIRGELHLCVRLARLLGIGGGDPAANESSRRRLLVVRRDAERWVFPVDAVDRIHRIPAESLTSVPATVGRSSRTLTRAVFHRESSAVGLLDDDRLFNSLRAGLR